MYATDLVYPDILLLLVHEIHKEYNVIFSHPSNIILYNYDCKDSTKYPIVLILLTTIVMIIHHFISDDDSLYIMAVR